MTTRAHALVDVIGRPFAIALTAGTMADIRAVPMLLPHLPDRTRYLIADKGCDANAPRKELRQRRTTPAIPGRANRKRKVRLDARRYRDRHPIEPQVREARTPSAGSRTLLRGPTAPPNRHPLRHTRPQLPFRRRTRSRSRLLALIESRAQRGWAQVEAVTSPIV